MDTIENESPGYQGDEPASNLVNETLSGPSFGTFSNPESQALGARVKLARGSLSQKQLADLAGVHFNTVGKVEKGSALDTKLLLRIAKVTDVNAAWLLMGEPFPMHGFAPPSTSTATGLALPAAVLQADVATVVPKSVDAVEFGAYVYVPHFDIHASAGPGFFNDVENVVAMRPFERGYIRSKLGISHNELALVNIIGRSMEPLLHSGDVSMLDRRDREVTVEGVHVIRIDGALMVKALQRRPGRVLRVSARNQEYEGFDITPDEDNQRDFEILGRLRWAGITLH